VRDLERTGGFGRKDLLVVTTTGSGWVDPALVDSFEYLSHGDSATVALQYSYLPSWVSYLVDQSKAREAGRALFDAVYGAWSQTASGPSPPAVRGRGKPGVVRRRDRLQRRAQPGQPHLRRTVRRGRPTSTRCSGSSAITVTRAARRSSPSTRTDRSCGSRMPLVRPYRRRASPGKAAGSCT